MPIDQEISDDGRLVVSKSSGTISGQDLADHMFWLINQFGVNLQSNYQHIFDTLDADGLDVNEEDLKRISQIILTYGQGRGKISTAIVADREGIRKMAYYYKSLSDITDITVEIFETRALAEEWLAGRK